MCESLGSTQSIPIMASTTQATSQPSALKTAIATLYHSGKYSDLTLECDGLRFKVHKSVVCGRSPVLEKECDGNFLEGKTGYVVVGAPDANRYTVRRMLDYLYKDDYNDCEPYSSIGFIAGASEEISHNDEMAKEPNTEANMPSDTSKNEPCESLASATLTRCRSSTGSLMGPDGPSMFGGGKSLRVATDPGFFFPSRPSSVKTSSNQPRIASMGDKVTKTQSPLASLRSPSLSTRPASMVQSATSPQPQPGFKSLTYNQSQEFHILNNVDVYALANYYQIVDLKHVAAAKFAKAIPGFLALPMDTVVTIIHEVYAVTDTASTLRITLVDTVAGAMNPKDTGWVEQLADVPEFVVAIFRKRAASDADVVQSQRKSLEKIEVTTEEARLRLITDILAHEHCAGGPMSATGSLFAPTISMYPDRTTSSSNTVNASVAQEKQAITRLKCRKCSKVIAEVHLRANCS